MHKFRLVCSLSMQSSLNYTLVEKIKNNIYDITTSYVLIVFFNCINRLFQMNKMLIKYKCMCYLENQIIWIETQTYN